MKATGIVRRVDELGRFVIPKELRRKYNINDNDSMEVFTDDKGLYLRKYNPSEDVGAQVDNLRKAIENVCDSMDDDKQQEIYEYLGKVKVIIDELED